MRNHLNKLAGAVMLQLFIFAYFWSIGNIITGKPDIRDWSDTARIVYITVSNLFSIVLSFAFLTFKDEEK